MRFSHLVKNGPFSPRQALSFPCETVLLLKNSYTHKSVHKMKISHKIFLSFLFTSLTFNVVFSQKKVVQLNLGDLKSALSAAPMQFSPAANKQPLVVKLPLLSQNERAFRVVESPIMAPDFAAAFPDFKTYAVQALDDPSVTGRISLTPYGFNGVILTLDEMIVIRPLDLLNPLAHEISQSSISPEEIMCGVDETFLIKKPLEGVEKSVFSNGSTLRTYSLAIVGTGEFYTANGGTIPAASAVVVSSVNGIQAIFERELAVNFQLLTPYLYTNPATDPFSPGLNRVLAAANAVEANFPGGNYDLGHVFHDQDEPPAELPGGGLAFLEAVCDNFTYGSGYIKGGGWSGSFNNTSGSWIKLAAHEFGHMFGMPHNFNGTGGACTSSIDSNNAYEIASGTTIMAYNGICGPGQNIPSGGTADHYFHFNSLNKAISYISSQSCETGTPSGNTPPTVNANPAGGTYTIPKGTPFRLTGEGTDADGDQIYYCWEQYDEDGANSPTQGFIGATAAASPIAPLFRSYPPTSSPTRTFPNMNFVVNNNYSSDFEPLPTVARTLNFRLTGRDLKIGGGGISSSDLAVDVSSSGPFTMTAPNGGETIAAGGSTTVTWDVNGTNSFCSNVNIRLSVDGGLTFPYLLLANTPNDGSQSVNIPIGVAASSSARMMVECADNTTVVFFDISNNNFTLTSVCNAAGSNICPTTTLSLPQGDPGLNLMLSRHYGSVVTQRTFNITNSSPKGPLADATEDGGTTCQTPWGNEKYEMFDFAVESPGSYTLTNTSGGQIIFSVFAAAGYNPASPCSSTFLGSNAFGAISYYNSTTVTLEACTVYKVVVWTLFNQNGAPVFTFSGAGSVYASGAGPGGDYSYTYAAVNTANGQVAAINATSDFTSLNAGDYAVYGVSYYSGAGPTPPTVNPATWIGQTIESILSSGACVLFSTNARLVFVTGAAGTPDVAISGSPALNEGNSGPKPFTFTVTRTGYLNNPSSVSWAVTGSGANPANAADFSGGAFPSGTVNFPAGSSASQTITVNVNGDTDFEPDEGFTVTLSNPVNANITTATASGTILNDDAEPVPNVAISGSPALNEGNSGPKPFTFTVTRTGYLNNPSSVSWAVTGSGANPANAADFSGGAFPSGTVNFPAGSSASQTITVNVNGDTDFEPDEGFTVTLSNPVNANITTATASGTILNDDAEPCPNTLAISGIIASGIYQAAMLITSTGTVPNGNVVTFKAGTSIELQPEFEVELGGELEVLIETCTPLTPPAPSGKNE